MVVDGIEFLIELEKKLEAGGNVDDQITNTKQK
jgi:hypothetical protein